jgi:hypothetical protein
MEDFPVVVHCVFYQGAYCNPLFLYILGVLQSHPLVDLGNLCNSRGLGTAQA